MTTGKFGAVAKPQSEMLYGPGYEARVSTDRPGELFLRVADLEDVHYVAQPIAQTPLTVIRFKSGEMFSTALKAGDLLQLLRDGGEFAISPVKNNETSDLHMATLGIINRRPEIAVIDLRSFDSGKTLFLNPGGQEECCIARDSMANCIREPGGLRSVIALPVNGLDMIKAMGERRTAANDPNATP